MPPSARPHEALLAELLREQQLKAAKLDAAISANLTELGYGD